MAERAAAKKAAEEAALRKTIRDAKVGLDLNDTHVHHS